MAFLWVRQSVFAFFGGYTMTSFYNEAVRHKKYTEGLTPAQRKQLDKAHTDKDMPPGHMWGRDGTFSDDVRKSIIEYEMPCAAALFLLVLAGGMFACLGAVGSLALEGPDGPRTYANLKRQLKERAPSKEEAEELTRDARKTLDPIAQDLAARAKKEAKGALGDLLKEDSKREA